MLLISVKNYVYSGSYILKIKEDLLSLMRVSSSTTATNREGTPNNECGCSGEWRRRFSVQSKIGSIFFFKWSWQFSTGSFSAWAVISCNKGHEEDRNYQELSMKYFDAMLKTNTYHLRQICWLLLAK